MASVGVQPPLIQPGRWSPIHTATDCFWEGCFCLLLGDLRKFLHICFHTSVEIRRCGDHSSHTAQIPKLYKSTSLGASGCVQSRLCCHSSCFDLSVSLSAVGHYCHYQWSYFMGNPWMCAPRDKRKRGLWCWTCPISILLSQIHTWHLLPAQHNKSVPAQGRAMELFW